MENKWYSTIYNSFLIVGIIILWCTIWSNTASNLTGTIIGYAFVIVGILMLLGYLMNNLNTLSSGSGKANTMSLIMSSITTLGPFVLLIGILVYMIYLLSYYYVQITNGRVSSGYNTFMNIFIILLMVEFYVLYNGMQDNNFKTTGTVGKVTGMVLYFLELISIVVIITLGIILRYFSTDG
jgi:hypothetical protein